LSAAKGTEAFKREAAARALQEVRSGMVLGLGTGSTMAHFLDLLGEALSAGTLTDVRGVASSKRTEREAGGAGIPLTSLAEHPRLDLTVDGADEVSPELDLIKGMGGALLREKMLAQAAARFLIIADEAKSVSRLGTRSALPVEVVDWGSAAHITFLRDWGADASVWELPDGRPYKTDNGNLILVCRFAGGIDDPRALHEALKARAGVIETGLFLGMADEAVFAGAHGLRILRRGA
jgi:ribose 5-phosphate isomerase A